MQNIIDNYTKIKNAIPQIIELSGYRNDYIAKQLGIKPSNFSVKKQRGNWNEEEVKIIYNTLRKPAVELDLYLQDVLDCVYIDEHLTGETLTSEEFEKSMGWL